MYKYTKNERKKKTRQKQQNSNMSLIEISEAT